MQSVGFSFDELGNLISRSVSAPGSFNYGEEFTYDYGKEYFDTHIKPNGCRCPKCAENRREKRKRS